MNKKCLTINVSEKVADMFLLAVSISGLQPDVVFEDFAKKYALEILQRLSSDLCEPGMQTDLTVEEVGSFFYEKTESKVLKKIPLWARKLNQINSQIIKVYFLCEQNEIASRTKMRELFFIGNPERTYSQFENNLNSMGTDKGNSHGHVFDFYGDEVHISKVAHKILLEYKSLFLSHSNDNNLINNGESPEKSDNLEKFEIYNLLESFKSYCKTPGIDSGKAQSYANAIQYLCDFLKVRYINEQVLAEFKNLELNIYRANNEIRNSLLAFLERRSQKSYLTGGFIKAALKYFYPFWERYKI